MEVCIDNIKSLENIIPTPAIRVELCSSLAEGGLTPSHGFHSIARSMVSSQRPDSLLIFPIIRPRGGDFLYTTHEVSIMKKDIEALSPADGFVIGCLTSSGGIDVESCKELIEVARDKDPSLPITFHRAFDMCEDPFEAVQFLMKLGVNRVLTSGTYPNAYEGRFMIRDLVKEFPSMTFMAGGGINKDNLNEILKTTHVKEFHASARSSYPSNMTFKNDKCYMGQSNRDEYSVMLTCQKKVLELTQIYDSYMEQR